MHLDRPGLARSPAFVLELLCRRGKRVRHRMPDVGAAVAVEIDGVFVIFRGQKLREAHRPAPGRAQIGARHAVLQHLQRVQELVAEKILALAGEGLRRQHLQRVVRLALGAEIGFAAPDRQHHIAGHAEGLSRCAKACRDIGQRVSALRGQATEARLAQILPRRLHEFRLLRLLFRPARQRKIRQRIIGLEAFDARVEHGARHAEVLRGRP